MRTLRHLVPAPPGALLVAAALLLGALVFATPGSAASMPEPKGKAVMAWHVTIAPSWFDPSSAPPQITPFGMLYAIHDALVRPYPGQKMGPSLAESWEESEDGKTYEFKLRPNLAFHNGNPVTTEDVKFSFERYKGAGAATLHDHVQAVEIVDPRVVRFHLKEPWPDFMTFYGTTAGAAGIVVPKKYLTEVGHGFKKHPIGAGGMTGWFRLSTKVPAFKSVYG
jgi:peptide/nickel transport system substrate-binding protein